MKAKRVLALCLAMMMTVTAFAACGNEGTTTGESTPKESTVSKESVVTDNTNEIPTYTAMGGVHNEERQPYTDENLTWRYMLDLAGVEIDVVQQFALSEAAEKGNLIMASGDYPEVLIKIGAIGLNDYGMNGALIPLEDLIRENMPVLSAYLDDYNAWDACRAADGHIYALPMATQSTFEGMGNGFLYINHKWLEALGLEKPTSMQELYDVLKAFKEKDPNGNGQADEIPLNTTDPTLFKVYQGGASLYNNLHLGVRDGELFFYPYDDLYREWLEWMTKFYAEGLLYENYLTQTWEEFLALGKSKEHDFLGGVTTNRMYVFTHEQYWDDYSNVVTFDPENVARGKGVELGGLAITDKCEDPATLLAAIDVWYTEESSIVVREGTPGVRWDYNADGNVEVKPESDATLMAVGMTGGAAFPGNGNYVDNMVWDNAANFRQAEAYQDGNVFSGGVFLPTLATTDEEGKTVATIKTDMVAYMNNFNAEVITGVKELNDSTWEEFKASLKKFRLLTY